MLQASSGKQQQQQISPNRSIDLGRSLYSADSAGPKSGSQVAKKFSGGRCGKQQLELRGFSTVDHHQFGTRGEGVKNPKYFVDVLYVWSLYRDGQKYASQVL